MAALPWFRLYHEFMNDPKIQMLSELDQRRYVMLLCIRCGNGSETLHETLHETNETDETLHETNAPFHDGELLKKIAFQLRISGGELRITRVNLMAEGLIDNHFNPLKWSERQYESDSSTERVRRYREKVKKQEKPSKKVNETLHVTDETFHVTPRNVSVTPPDTDTDTDTDTDIKKVTKKNTISIPSDINPLVWKAFIASRSKLKAPNSDHALKLVLTSIDRCRQAGYDVNEVINKAIERGWKSVDAEWMANSGLKIMQNHQVVREIKNYAQGGEGFSS